jgi:(p)ppGpp synthase/HD superfamily hydrolase
MRAIRPEAQKETEFSMFRDRAYEAMMFAREVHRDQVRRYTGNPYVDHLAEVCGIAMSVGWHNAHIHPDTLMAVCWLHDCIEDQGVEPDEIQRQFGDDVALGVTTLSDLEVGNRAERKAASRDRLAKAPGWVQTIKVADLISNTSSIVQHDPKFAVTYLEEKRLLLDVLTKADPRLVAIARRQATLVEAQ